ncbi:MAG TPA: hypothetical protein VM939_05075 [Gemmatimonadaceae bacterium]|nr:hypothetical protein [Gemmatimonadaceae bacterium]
MKLPNPVSLLKDAASRPARGRVVRALQIGAGAASAIIIALQLRRELYGPGGTKLNRFPPSTEDREYAKERRARRAAAKAEKRGD